MGVGSVVDVTITPALLDVHAATVMASATARRLNLCIVPEDTTPMVEAVLS
jgi:hypothetical protein